MAAQHVDAAQRPPSLLTQAYLLENYGPRLTVEQLASVLHMARNTVYNQVAAGTFAVSTYVDGNKRFADYRDVATYLDDCRGRARGLGNSDQLG